MKRARGWIHTLRVACRQTCPSSGRNSRALRRQVWELLCEVERGDTVTYGELARRYAARTGRRTGARAIGMAVGRNPISIMIPCHRVLGADGSLTGYAGGLERKRALLMLERGTDRMGSPGSMV